MIILVNYSSITQWRCIRLVRRGIGCFQYFSTRPHILPLHSPFYTYGMPLFINQSFQAGTILPHATHNIGRKFVNTRDRGGMHEFIRHIISDLGKLYISLIGQNGKSIGRHPDKLLRTVQRIRLSVVDSSIRRFVQIRPDSSLLVTADSGDNRRCWPRTPLKASFIEATVQQLMPITYAQLTSAQVSTVRATSQ